MATPSTSTSRQAGAVSVGDDRKRGAGWLRWLLPLLLLLLVVVIAVVLLSRHHKANGGTVISQGTNLVGDDAPTGAALSRFDNQAVVGDHALVRQLAGEKGPGDNNTIVNDDERFFVGSAAHEILAVVGTGKELPQALPAGHRISFRGTVKAYNGDPKSIGIDPAFSDKVKAEGSYIEIDPASVVVQQ